MKALLILILMLGLVRAEDITTTDGTVHKNAKIISHDAVNATIIDDSGGGLVPISNLPPSLQKRLCYDPAVAQKTIEDQKAAAIKRAHDAALATQLSTKALTVKGGVVTVLPSGILAHVAAYSPSYGGWVKSISESGTVFISCKTDGLIDDQAWSGTIWKVGTYSYTSVLGAPVTVDKFTTSPQEAAAALASQP